MSRSVVIRIRIESTPNLREHWAARAKRTREHRQAVWWHLKAAKFPVELPCAVTMTRIAPRSMDGDNLQAGCKGARDGVADWLMADDNDARIEWRYAQEKGEAHEYALRIELA